MFEELVIECPDLTIVEYHSLDDYSNIYSDARILFYDIMFYPHSRIDGFFQPDWNIYEAYVEDYETRMATATSLSVSLELEGNGTDFNGSVAVGWLNTNNTNRVLYLVLTESHIPESWYGGEELNYVTRLMVPDENGIPIEGSKNPDAIYDFNFTMDPEWIKDSCELVAFVQDTVTLEVIQANAINMADVEISWFDVAVESINHPGDVHCEEILAPEIQIKNLCLDVLNSCVITYEINGDEHEYIWTGELDTD